MAARDTADCNSGRAVQNEVFAQRDRIQALKAPDLLSVARAHLHPAKQVLEPHTLRHHLICHALESS